MRAYALAFVAIAAGCHQIVGIEPLRDPPPDAGAPPDAATGLPGPTPVTSSTADAKAPDAEAPDAAPACASPLFEPFATTQVPSAWTRLLENGGVLNFETESVSPPLALHAFGMLKSSASEQALIRTTRQGPIRGRVDLGFQTRFDRLITNARLSAGCMLDLQNAEEEFLRAHIAVGFGIPGYTDGVFATVEVYSATPPAPAPVKLFDQISASTWYLFHIRAVADGKSLSFVFDVAGGGTDGTKASTSVLTVPFGEVTSLELSCGIDHAYSNAAGADAPFSVRVDDVALDICP